MSKKIKIEHQSGTGIFWCVGWLFTIGFLNLSFGQGLLAILLWPYYLGSHFSGLF